MFTELEKVDIRRFIGFSVYGSSAANTTFGYRYFEDYLTIEYRMNNLTTDEEDVVRTKYLTNCRNLEDAIPTASDNLDTDRAAVWYHNKDEVEDRFKLYKLWCQRLAEFFGVKAPSALMGGFRIVV